MTGPAITEGQSIRTPADEHGNGAQVFVPGQEAEALAHPAFNEQDFQYFDATGVTTGFADAAAKRADPDSDPTVVAGRVARAKSTRDRAVGPNEAQANVAQESAEDVESASRSRRR